MNLKERISDLFEKYSVNLKVEEKEEKKMDEHKDKEELAKKTLANGTEIFTDSDEFKVGSSVFIVNDEGERMPLPDGEYEYEGGGKTKVADGKVVEMEDHEEDEKKMDEHEDKEKKMDEHKDKDKEKMAEEEEVVLEVEPSVTLSQTDLEELIAKVVGEARQEFAKEAEATKEELASVKEVLASQRAEEGLRQAKQPEPHMTAEEISMLPTKDRVNAIYEIYSNQ